MDNRIAPVEALINTGLAQRFHEVFGTVLHYSTSVDKKATLQKILGNEPPKYPIAFAAFKGLALDTTRYAPTAMLRRGVISAPSHDNVTASRLTSLPSITTFEITFLTDNIRHVTAFAKRWLFAGVEGSLKFTVSYGVVDIDIHIDLDQEVNIPEKPDGVTEVGEYEIVLGLRVHGFHSKGLDKVQAVTSIEVDGAVVSESDYKALTQEGKDNVTVHLFKREWNAIPGPEGSAQDPRDVGV